MCGGCAFHWADCRIMPEHPGNQTLLTLLMQQTSEMRRHHVAFSGATYHATSKVKRLHLDNTEKTFPGIKVNPTPASTSLDISGKAITRKQTVAILFHAIGDGNSN